MSVMHPTALPLATIALALRLGGGGAVPATAPPQAAVDTIVAATDPNARCVMRRGAWTPIPFQRVDLGPDVTNVAAQGIIIYGPHTRTVVTDSVRWPAVWQAAMDPSYSPDTVRLRDGRDSVVAYAAPLPPIEFRRDAIVFTTTKTYRFSPIKLEITSIRRCRRTGVVVVQTLETRPYRGSDYPCRAFLAVRVRRDAVARAPVVFVDRRRSVADVTY